MASAIIIEGPTVSRSQLYALVWRHESQALAAACGIAGSLIGRVCKRWNIPKPPRGYWQQIEAGQTPKRPHLPPWAGNDPDPVALQKSARGYSSVVPPVARLPRPKKRDALDTLAAFAAAERHQKEQRQASLVDMMEGPARRYVLAIEDWNAEHQLETGYVGEVVHFEDSSSIELVCSRALPNKRRSKPFRVCLQFDNPEFPADERDPHRGSFDDGKRLVYLHLASDRAAYVCAALAAGKLRYVDLEVVEGRGRERPIRWASLCTRIDDTEA